MNNNRDNDHKDSEGELYKDTKFEFKDKKLYEKICYIKSNITVEPILAGLVIASTLAKLATQNLNLDKTCRLKFHYGDEICDALIQKKENMSHYEGEIQKVVSSIEVWKSIISTSIPTILMIIMGAWSDRTGNRKICILAPIAGEFMVCLSNILSTVFFYEVPVEVTMFFEAFFPAITGGWVMINLGVCSYISDITSAESRTMRIGLANLCLRAGVPIGTALSGILLKFTGYYGIFAISAIIHLIIFYYGYMYLESNTRLNHEVESKEQLWSFKDCIIMVKDTVAVAFKKRDGNYRQKIILILLVVIIIYGPEHAEKIVFYMFLRYRFKWDALKYSIYSTYSIIAHSLGALFSLTVLSKTLGWDDTILCLISITSKFFGSFYITLVQNDFQMFLFPIVEILNATTFTALRSMTTKLVQSKEIGKINSLVSLVETMGALVFDPSYSAIYSKTVMIFSKTVFVFSAFLALPSIAIVFWLFVNHRQESKVSKSIETEHKINKQNTAQYEEVAEKTEISRV